MEDPPDSHLLKKWPARPTVLLALFCLLLGNLSANYVDLSPSSIFSIVGSSGDSSPRHGHHHLRSRHDNGAPVVTDQQQHQDWDDLLHRSLEDDCEEASANPLSDVPFAVQIIMIVILISMSAMFSGLTLGLMGLDKTGLEIVMEGDDEKNAAAARIIYPIRSDGNLLLCTLLLGNVAVNALLSILLADKAGGIVGFLASTFIIVIFGEIVPQALCQRYSLQIGSKAVPLVRVIKYILLPITYPIAFALDKALGHELATTYSNSEMSKLLEIHVKEGRFDQDVGTAMAGALKYKDIPVKDVMTPLENTFMLNVDEKLNFDNIATIFKTGYSRIPVYEVSMNNIIGLLFVKDLIFIDPEDETPVRNFVQIFGRGVHVVWPDDKLGDVLKELKQGRSHMAIVRDVNNENEEADPYYEIKGIITLEDIIEEILGDEIVDETDAFVDGTHSVKVSRMEGFDWGRLRLLDAKIVDETLSLTEVKAVCAHLRTNYTEYFELCTDKQLHRLITETSVVELPTAEQELGQDVPDDLMYERDVTSDLCTLILSGKVTVIAGQDSFRSDVSSWSVLAATALTSSTYVPDFTAFVSSGPCRTIRISREEFTAAVDASVLERQAMGSNRALPEGETNTKNDTDIPGSSQHGTNNHVGKSREEIKSRRSKLIAAMQSFKGSADESDTTGDDQPTTMSTRSKKSSIDYMEGHSVLMENNGPDTNKEDTSSADE